MPPSKPKPKPPAKVDPGPSASEPVTNTRIFNPHAYFPTDLLEDPSELRLSQEITLFDPDTSLTNLLFFGRVKKLGHRTVSKVAEPRGDEIVVCVAGVHCANRTGKVQNREKVGGDGAKSESGGRAAYSIFFGPESKFNASGTLPKEILQTAQASELCAVRAAMQFFQNTLLKERKTMEKLVIMSHSECVVQGLTWNVWKWEEKGYKTSRGKRVVDEGLFREIHELILDLNGRGVSVEFWKVDRLENEDAVNLAWKAFEKAKRGNDIDGKWKVQEKEDRSKPSPAAPKISRSAALTFWLNEATSNPEAKSLCALGKISMPTSSTSTSSSDSPINLDHILSQLIILGLDTPDNFSVLFGTEWEAGIKRVWARKRVRILADPPGTLNSKWWHLRESSEEEEMGKYDDEGALREMEGAGGVCLELQVGQASIGLELPHTC